MFSLANCIATLFRHYRENDLCRSATSVGVYYKRMPREAKTQQFVSSNAGHNELLSGFYFVGVWTLGGIDYLVDLLSTRSLDLDFIANFVAEDS